MRFVSQYGLIPLIVLAIMAGLAAIYPAVFMPYLVPLAAVLMQVARVVGTLVLAAALVVTALFYVMNWLAMCVHTARRFLLTDHVPGVWRATRWLSAAWAVVSMLVVLKVAPFAAAAELLKLNAVPDKGQVALVIACMLLFVAPGFIWFMVLNIIGEGWRKHLSRWA